MNINLNKINIELRKSSQEDHENLLAYINIGLEGDNILISLYGATLWLSKINNDYNLEFPRKKRHGFMFYNVSEELYEEIKHLIVEEYEKESIPVIDEGTKYDKPKL
jgi:hypothetical protein